MTQQKSKRHYEAMLENIVYRCTRGIIVLKINTNRRLV